MSTKVFWETNSCANCASCIVHAKIRVHGVMKDKWYVNFCLANQISLPNKHDNIICDKYKKYNG